MDWLTNPETWISLLTLTLLEIVLGIDNLVFISILSNKLPEDQRDRARQVGLVLALGTRILLLLSLAWIMGLQQPLFTLLNHAVTGRDLILIVGGMFLLAKSTHEIHEKLEGEDGAVTRKIPPTFNAVIVQIMLLDIVFSLDSVITAVGMVKSKQVMIAAVVLAMIFMLVYSGKISAFINRHPTIKMLALSFLLMIGCMLVAEGFHKEIPKGYVYFAMAFSVGVEFLNMRVRSPKPDSQVKLNQPYR